MKPVPNFRIANIEGAGEILLADERCHFKHVVSIGEIGGQPPLNLYDNSSRRVLRLEFDDVTYRRHADEGGYVRANKSQMKSLISFLREVNEPILFHCMAGVSRSAAAATVFACMKLGEGREKEAMELVLKVRSIAHPNKHMLRLADDLLGRGGKILETSFSFWNESDEHKRELMEERGT
jgi:predicted protein tyrosine phosphatase